MFVAPAVLLLLLLVVLSGAVRVVTLLRRRVATDRTQLEEARIRSLEDRLDQLEDMVIGLGSELRQLSGESVTPLPPRAVDAPDAPAGLPRGAERARARG